MLTQQSAWWSRADAYWQRLDPRPRMTAAGAMWLLATVPMLSRLFTGGTAVDLAVFQAGAEALTNGARVYGEVEFEYPPYALLWFVAPYVWAGDAVTFRTAFGLEIWLVDASLKAGLLWLGMRSTRRLRALTPFWLYTLGTAALGHLLLQRFDLIPAALSAVAVVALTSGWPMLAGVVTMVAVGSKLYPLLLLPLFLLLLDDRRSVRRFLAGVAAGAIPLVLAGFWVPWWRFATYHAARGLQAESLAASVLWALHFAGVPASWEYMEASKSREVTGAIASSLVLPARALWLTATLACLARASGAVLRSRPVHSASSVAAVALLPLTAFVSLNTVLSPQYHLWLLPLAALVFVPSRDGGGPAASARMRRGAALIVLATLIVPTFYPSREHDIGLGLWRTSLLLLRNVLLLQAAYFLWKGAAEPQGPAHERHRRPQLKRSLKAEKN